MHMYTHAHAHAHTHTRSTVVDTCVEIVPHENTYMYMYRAH